MTHPAIAALRDWLIDGGRSEQDAQKMLDATCRRLVEAGVPLSRVGVFIQTLHPNVVARRFVWRPGAAVQMSEATYETAEQPEYKASPMAHVYEHGTALRRRLVDPDCPIDYPVLQEFREQGITDYLIVPLRFSDGSLHAVTFATVAPQGFDDAHVAAIDTIVIPLARVAEIRAARRTAITLLETYVGQRSGARILAGHIRRGDVETIEAAFWYSDLREFTALNEALAPHDLIVLLNEYFGAVTNAVTARGGEVLQFIGDAALAIFPVGSDTDGRRGACRAALDAAYNARESVAAINRGRVADGRPTIRFGIGLHVGAVSWGNVGGVDRLGLNVIGPAVNRTARLETLTKQVGLPVLLSQDFADALGVACRPVGRFTLKGVPEPQAVYAPPEA
ncbi:MAG TPA: adenylate/guanylate cyclase domain-containing protein [Candidatus Sulfotelmatobacter sp.]|nr:adenylate/guanylate cyclase domain-containing protein [Candidatus Sulfotelmatobacter sp.]